MKFMIYSALHPCLQSMEEYLNSFFSYPEIEIWVLHFNYVICYLVAYIFELTSKFKLTI